MSVAEQRAHTKELLDHIDGGSFTAVYNLMGI
jgi:hypothetical protein